MYWKKYHEDNFWEEISNNPWECPVIPPIDSVLRETLHAISKVGRPNLAGAEGARGEKNGAKKFCNGLDWKTAYAALNSEASGVWRSQRWHAKSP